MTEVKKMIIGCIAITVLLMPLAVFGGYPGKYEYASKYIKGGWSNQRFMGSQFIGKQLVLNAKGKATAYLCDIPATELGTTQALCFDVPLFNMKTGAYVGVLTDKLADVTPVDGGGLTVIATSTFKFTEWKKKPSFTTRVLGNVQPFIDGSESMTHVTGYIPYPGENNILSGTKQFRHASGSVRESGAVNLASFQGLPGDEVVIDFIWVINFD